MPLFFIFTTSAILIIYLVEHQFYSVDFVCVERTYDYVSILLQIPIVCVYNIHVSI